MHHDLVTLSHNPSLKLPSLSFNLISVSGIRLSLVRTPCSSGITEMLCRGTQQIARSYSVQSTVNELMSSMLRIVCRVKNLLKPFIEPQDHGWAASNCQRALQNISKCPLISSLLQSTVVDTNLTCLSPRLGP